MPGRRSEVTERRNRVARQSPNSVKRAYAMSDAISRRSLFKAAGAVGVAAALPGEGVARPATPLAEPLPAKPPHHMHAAAATGVRFFFTEPEAAFVTADRKSTSLNSSH